MTPDCTQRPVSLGGRAMSREQLPRRNTKSRRDITGRRWRTTRYAVRVGKEHLKAKHRGMINALRRGRYQLGRAWELI